MTDSIIERMARAHDQFIWEQYDRYANDPSGEIQAARETFRIYQIARMKAALAAARVPSERMVEAGDAAQTEEWGEQVAMSSSVPWTAMIDAELGADPDAGG